MMKTRRSFKRMLSLLLCIVLFVTLLPNFALAALAAPTLNSATATANGIVVKWEGVKNAVTYRVYRKDSGSYSILANKVSGTSYTDTSVQKDVTYTYTVRCLDKDGKVVSPYNTGVSATWTESVLETPVVKSAKAVSDGIKVTWGEVADAASYRIYRKEGSGSYSVLKSGVTGTSYTDKTAKVGKTYTYTVRCLNKAGKVCSGYESAGKTATFNPYPAPELISVTAGSDGIVIKWKAVSGAPKYMIYRKDSGAYSRLASTTATSYTDKTANVNVVYTYTVRVCSADGKNILSAYNTGLSASFAGKAAVSSLENKPNYVLVKWSEVPGITDYQVMRKMDDGSWKGVTVVSSSPYQYKDTDVVSGKTYTYRVRGVDGSLNTVGTYDAAGKTITYYAAPTLVDAVREKNGIRFTWEAVDGVSTYRVYRKIGSGNYEKQSPDVTGTSFFDTNVASNVKPQYTVRCVVGGNLVSGYNAGVSPDSATFYDTPLLTGVSYDGGGLKVTWQRVNGVSRYQIFRKDPSKTSWDPLATVTGASTQDKCFYIDTSAKVGGQYSYTVACLDSSNVVASEKNETGLSATYYATPVLSGVTNANTGALLKWKPVDGVTSYRIYRKEGSGDWSVLTTVTRKDADKVNNLFQYTDTTAVGTHTYWYTVSCVVKGADMSAYDTAGVKTQFFAMPKLTKVEVASKPNGVVLKWSTVDGIGTYRIYRKESGSGSWAGSELVDTTGNTYTDNTVSSNKTYYYTIRGVNESGKVVTGFDSAGKSVKVFNAPVLISAASGDYGITVKWNSVSGAPCYAVYRKTETGSWKRVGTTTGTSYKDPTSNLESGVKYIYTVRVCTNDSAHTVLSAYDSTGKSATAK